MVDAAKEEERKTLLKRGLYMRSQVDAPRPPSAQANTPSRPTGTMLKVKKPLIPSGGTASKQAAGTAGMLTQPDCGGASASIAKCRRPLSAASTSQPVHIAAPAAHASSASQPVAAPAPTARAPAPPASVDPYTREVQHRVQRWYQAMQVLKGQTDSQEFLYLVHADPNAVWYNPYNLEIVAHAMITGTNYYTMSPHGVTHFVDGAAEFVSLDQWERDYLLYTQVVKLKLFSQFRLWKSFRTWRNRFSRKKTRTAKAVLEKSLFYLDPVLSRGILQIRSACQDLQQLKMHSLQQGTIYTLEQLASMHDDHLQHINTHLSAFVKQTVGAAQDACTQAMEDQEKRMTAAKEAKYLASLGSITHGSGSRAVLILRSKVAASTTVSPAAAAYIREGADFSYAIQAEKRSAKRRLSSFVRLLDFIIGDTLHALLTATVQDILGLVRPPPALSAETPPSQANPLILDVGDADAQPAQDTPLLQVALILDESTDKLLLQPPREAFSTAMEGLLTAFVTIVSSVERLQAVPYFQDLLEHHTEPFLVEGLLDLLLGEGHQKLEVSVLQALDDAFASAEEQMQQYLPYRDMVVKNRSLTVAVMRREVDLGLRVLDQFSRDLTHYQQEVEDIMLIPKHRDVGIVRLELSQVATAVLPSPSRCLASIHSLLPELAHASYTRFIARVHDATQRLASVPTNVNEFVEYLKFIQVMENERQAFDEEADQVAAHYKLMEKFAVKVPEMQLAAYRTMEDDLVALRDAMWRVESSRERYLQQFCKELDTQVDDLNREVTDIRILAQHAMIMDERSDQAGAIAYAAELLEKVAAQKEAAARIIGHQRLFKHAETRFNDLEDCAEEVELKYLLRKSLLEWEACTREWLATPLLSLTPTAIEEQVSTVNKVAHKTERGLPPSKMVAKLKDSVAFWKELVPLIFSLRNPDLKDRHWNKIEALLKAPIVHADDAEHVLLAGVIQMNAMSVKDELTAASTEATQEAVLEGMLDKVHERWKSVEFAVNAYKEAKDTFVLGGVEDIMQVLEESLMSMAVITSSRYATGIRSEVEKLERQLSLFSDTLEVWLEVQQSWLYLEAVFSSPDIIRQLPTESRAFAQVDRQFRDIMRKTKDRPNALQAATVPGLLHQLEGCSVALQEVQKSLEDYLETKRTSFPRFYFLSNEELLDILSQSKNPQAVQPHLSKCFDGIRQLDFADDKRSIDILAMISSEGERVSLGKNLKARGPVETWLTAVEANMKASLRGWAKRAQREYAAAHRTQWVLEQPAQLSITTSNIHWCQDVEQSLLSSDPAMALSLLHTKNVDQLVELTALVRGKLSSLQRKVATALITIDVHNRDIVEALSQEKCMSPADFAWQMQLRYYWDSDQDTVVIKQINAVFQYGFEYLGAQPRLVVTPMTDRCYMTLMGALHLKLGGAPAGPAGTGKTETTKDLGKALGVQCVVFNCGENLDYKFMGKFFSGLAQCGAWACFDEFNRIDIEVLSVVAQQLLTIQNALKANVTQFVFEGRTIKLLPTCGVFITMNPGYAGRTELPDNLKALFRPMAMMIPDYALVAEVMLFSEGFNSAKALSRKMVQLYKLCSEQLSQQDHYDFGMRALKSVLVMAGAQKRLHSDLIEEVILIRAMQDSNVPKFLAQDVLLFNAIVSDLFPGIPVPEQDRGQLQVAVQDSCIQHGLQPVPTFVHKVVQLQETFNVRFGVMLVGPTGGGKTQCYRMLQAALNSLHSTASRQAVQSFVLNPKSIQMGELFGEYNSATNEWADGVASSIIRNATAATKQDSNWIVFDGPVDAVWVENMNTVLDDNCTLCLPNGERIKLDAARMRILFEVQDLAVASPATVSRCGMVYICPEDTGWQPYVKSWLGHLSAAVSTSGDTKQAPLASEVGDYLWGLFEEHLDAGLAFVHSAACKEAIPSVAINKAASITAIFEAMVHKRRGFNLHEELTEGQKLALQNIFLFSYIWGLGGNLSSASWAAFDTFVRAQFLTTATFPASGSATVYDFCLQPERNHTFELWEKVVHGYAYDASMPYFQIVVPTVDTTRFGFLLESCLEVDRGVLLVGTSGVGKTAVVSNTMHQLCAGSQLLSATLNFSAQTSSNATQATIEGWLEKRRKNRFGPPGGRRLMLFVDDVNMPAREVYGAQPPNELLRQLVDCRGFYHRRKLNWQEIEDVVLLAACCPPGGGRQEVTPRLFRHFTMLNMPQPSEMALRTIFHAILSGFFDRHFTPDVGAKYTRPMVECTVELYSRVCKEFLPTPSKSHYTFNLRDVSKVFQGITSVRPASCGDVRRTMPRLWAHENMRVLHDRLVSAEDKDCMLHMLHDMLVARFEVKATYQELFQDDTIMFGDYLKLGVPREDRQYEEVTDMQRLQSVFQAYQDDYSISSRSSSLVFFKDAMEHFSRISRILRQPRGNALLVGVGGSGKQTVTRFAAFVAGMPCVSIELTRGYGIENLREDLRKLYRRAGVNGEHVVFLFMDNHAAQESFVEDINCVLSSGDIAGMYKADEKEAVLQDIRPWIEQQGLPTTRDAMWSAFISRVRDNLHVVLAMSPVGEAFRSRCRQFPALINCTTMDWFSRWSDEAMLSVASRYLQPAALGSQQLDPTAIASMCVFIHTSVEQAAERYFQELRRRFYVTPKTYLDVVNLYLQLLAQRQRELQASRDRLLNGLDKLQEANDVVDRMQTELAQLQPVLAEKTAATQDLLTEVKKEQDDANRIKAGVAAEEVEVGRKAKECLVLKDDALRELQEVLPALEAAEKALNALNKADIIEIKTFTKPPALVQLTLEGVCILLQEKPDWESAKKVLGDANFIKRLIEFDKENVPEKVTKAIKRIITDPAFTPDQVAKQSKAAQSMCLWVRAMDTYAKVSKVVEPKRQALGEAQAALDTMNRQLAAKQLQLEEIVAKVKALEDHLQQTQHELQSLQYQAELSRKRLANAGKLISALGNEAVRWKSTTDDLAGRLQLLVGDVLLSSACISYMGAFTGSYREELVAAWLKQAAVLGIPTSPQFCLVDTLATPVEVREWQLQGLPTDAVSTDNAILATRGSRWPLLIDPQRQALTWVKAMEADAGLKVVKASGTNLLRVLEGAIRLGTPVLLQDVGEELDPALEPLLQKNIFFKGNRQLIRLGETDVEYSPSFRFYITTLLSNPHYLPEVCIKVNLINFTVTPAGLEDQLLGEVVRQERPELEEQKGRLVVGLAADKRQLMELEDRILLLLRESKGNILDDELLINTLNNSKQTAGVIQARVAEAEQTEVAINTMREQYRAVPVRAAVLFFNIADLVALDPMYQHSLAQFLQLFAHCMRTAEPSEDLPTRLLNLQTFTTHYIFSMVCRSLFDEHKSIFSFLLATSILQRAGTITPTEWSFFLRGSRLPTMVPPSPDPSWLPLPVWQALHGLVAAAPAAFKGLTGSIAANVAAWKQLVSSEELQSADLGPLLGQEVAAAMQDFHRLMLLKVLKEDAVAAGVQHFVAANLGHQFTEGQPFSMQQLHSESTAATPIVFILTQGADPTPALQRFSDSMGHTAEESADKGLVIISLGQGQGPVAEAAIRSASTSGGWVCLQNCHLARSWMPRLEAVVEELQEQRDLHPDFRLWLTSMPAQHFPVSVLQCGVKVALEPPKGLRANLLRCYSELPVGFLEDSALPPCWQRLVFATCFFHAMVQERRRFGALGWNIPYEFLVGDLSCGLQSVAMFLQQQDPPPWRALQYVVGQINYGGRVTDDNDRRLLTCIVERCLGPQTLEAGFALDSSGAYTVPPAGRMELQLHHIRGLPAEAAPTVFGLHANAAIAFQVAKARHILDSILLLQPHDMGAATGGKSTDEMVLEVAAEIAAGLPGPLLRENASVMRDPFAALPGGHSNSLGTVLQQEMERYNTLLGVVRRSVVELQQGLKGLVVMSAELEAMYSMLLNNQVPTLWARAAYPNLKPLASWLHDFKARIAMLESWLTEQQPASFWLPGLFYPQGFMTAVLQNHARKTQTPIDSLQFRYVVLPPQQQQHQQSAEQPRSEPPDDGVYVHGLFLESARWDAATTCLQEAQPGVMFTVLPTIHLIPTKDYQPPPEDFQCPLYKTAARAGVLSTTGQSTNFISHISLPIDSNSTPEFWIRQGVSALCALST